MHHADVFDEMLIEEKKSASSNHSNIEYNVVQKLLFEAKCLSPPDVYILEDKGRNWTHKRLALENVVDSVEYILEPISDLHQIVQCLVS